MKPTAENLCFQSCLPIPAKHMPKVISALDAVELQHGLAAAHARIELLEMPCEL